MKAATTKSSQDDPLVYIVDDEPMLLELATVILEPRGYHIKTFRDPQTALESFRRAQSHPALIITDYAMHQMNGVELVQACKKIRPGQKILLLSGTADEQVYRNARFKPDGFLAKPYRARQLIQAVRGILAQMQEPT